MRYLSVFYLRGVVLTIALMFLAVAGIMPTWSQNSDLKLSGSETSLQTWSNLHGALVTELTGLRSDLTQARTSSAQWMSLSEQSLTRIDSLETYNEQIGQRMQARDMDLYWAYQDIDRLEKESLKKDKIIITLSFILAGIVLLIVAFVIVRIKSGRVFR
jgi:hypothetical protein